MSLKNKTIFIVDDDSKFIILLSKIFESLGMIVESSTDFKNTYDTVKKLNPDILLLDLNLAEHENGMDFLNKRSQDIKLKHIPVIICSPNSNKTVIKKIFDLGANDFLLKPIRQDWLIQKIKKVLKTIDFLEYKFLEDNKPNIEAKVWGEVIELGEANCKVRSPLSIAKNREINVNFVGLETIIPINKKIRSDVRSIPSMSGLYDTYFTLIGVSEKEASKLRKAKAKWEHK